MSFKNSSAGASVISGLISAGMLVLVLAFGFILGAAWEHESSHNQSTTPALSKPLIESRVEGLESTVSNLVAAAQELVGNDRRLAEAVYQDMGNIQSGVNLMEKTVVNCVGEKKWLRAVAEEQEKMAAATNKVEK